MPKQKTHKQIETTPEFKNSPLHDKQKILRLMDKLTHSQMIEVVDHIQRLADCQYTIEIEELDRIEDAVSKAIDLAKKIGKYVEFKFNGVDITVTEESDIDNVVLSYIKLYYGVKLLVIK